MPTSPSSKRRTRRAWPPTARRRPAVLERAGALSDRGSRQCMRPTSPTPTSRCSAAPAGSAACVRRPNEISPTGLGPRHGFATPACGWRSAATRTRSSSRSKRRVRSSSTSDSRPACADRTARPSCWSPRRRTATRASAGQTAARSGRAQLADFVALGLDSVRLAGTRPEDLVDSVVFAGGAQDVRDVIVGGRIVVRDGRHATIDVPLELASAIGRGGALSTTGDRQHRLARHERPGVRRRSAGTRARCRRRHRRRSGRGDRGVGGRRPIERIDAGGRCVIPGFVDSHTHLVFAGDRAEEFAARMAGAPYAAGGIRSTVAQTKAALTDELREADVGPASRGDPGRDHPPRDQVWLRARRRRRAAALRARGRAHRRRHLPRCARAPVRVRASIRRVRRARLRRDARCVRAARPLDRRVLRARRVRRRPEPRSARGRPPRRARAAVHANQLGHGARRAASPSRSGAASADHCTHLSRPDVEALAGSHTVATLLPATDFSTRQPYPNARRLLDAGRDRRARDQLQPGLELHDLDELLHRARRPRDANDRRGGAARRDGRRRAGAPAARARPAPPRVPRRRGRAGRALVPRTSSTGRAMPLIAGTVVRGRLEWAHPELGVTVG